MFFSFLWLILGTVLLLFSNTSSIISVAVWIAPIFIIRFIRIQKQSIGLLASLLSYMTVYIVINRNAFPLTGVTYYAAAGFFGFVYWVPYVADRLIATRLKGILSTLVFPLAYVSWEFIYASFSPYLSFGSLAYTQYGNLPIMQIASLAGIWGVIFMTTWFASIINWIWEQNLNVSKLPLNAGLIAAIYALTFLFGGLSLQINYPKSDTVRISSITATSEIEALLEKTNWDNKWSDQDTSYVNVAVDKTKSIFAEVLDNYLSISRQQAQVGSKIILLQEGAVFAFKEDEARYIEIAKKLADKENIYLFMPMLVITEGFPATPAENKVVCMDPNGKLLFKYLKSFPVPSEPSIKGNGKIHTVDTPYGRISLAICFDFDNPMFIRQAGSADADILLNPAFDWKGITPYHAYSSAYRAVENGASLVRCTGHGYSAAYDYQGRVLVSQNYFNNIRGVMVSHIPVKGAQTFYSHIGDSFAWLCISMFIVFWGYSLLENFSSFINIPFLYCKIGAKHVNAIFRSSQQNESER